MNRTGKGGFQDHPELINRNGRPKLEDSLTDALRAIVNPKELAQMIYNMAIADRNLNAAIYVYNRIEGTPKVTQYIQTINAFDAEWLEAFKGLAKPEYEPDDPPEREILPPAEERDPAPVNSEGLDDSDY